MIHPYKYILIAPVVLTAVIYLLIRFNKSKFYPCNTNNTDGNGVNKQNTHTHAHHMMKITLERLVSVKISDTSPF